jgi:hypothetical protein
MSEDEIQACLVLLPTGNPRQDLSVPDQLAVVAGVDVAEGQVEQGDRGLGRAGGVGDVPPQARGRGVDHPRAGRGEQDAAGEVLLAALACELATTMRRPLSRTSGAKARSRRVVPKLLTSL